MGEIGHDNVGTMGAKFFGIVAFAIGIVMVNANDQPKVARPASFNTRESVLKDNGSTRLNAENLRPFEKTVGCWLSRKMAILYDMPIDNGVEHLIHPRGLESRFGILASRNNGDLGPVFTKLVHERYCTLEDGHSLGPHHLEYQIVLAVSYSLDSLSTRRIVIRTLGESDSSCSEEVANAVFTRFTVDVRLVVALGIKWCIRLTSSG
jgi:hypothetical protein